MDIKSKICESRTWGENYLFLDISSTDNDTLVPSLYQCVETPNTEVFWLLSQPLPHFRFNLFLISKSLPRFSTKLWIALRDKHFPPQTGNISLWKSFALRPFAPKKRTTERCSSIVHPQARSPLWLLKPASEYEHARLLHRLSWSWTVLLPSDTHRKPIAFIIAVSLPFVAYLLTLPIVVYNRLCAENLRLMMIIFCSYQHL
jgi:hypothetical protein